MKIPILHAKTLLLVTLLAVVVAGCPAVDTGTDSASSTDTTPPTPPANLTATAAGASVIDLSWPASFDNVGVTGYRVERCQGAGCGTFVQIAPPNGTGFSDTGLAAATSYSYRVRATDAAGNFGSYSIVANATTTGTAEAIPPSTPANLMATAAGASAINLSWDPSFDNVGVTGYIVRRDGAVVATAVTTSYADTGLSAATTYSYTVAARDAAGNVSLNSATASATTQGTTGTLPLGALVHDGPATPEQISLFLPVTTGGSLPQTATAAVRYRPTGSLTWTTGHPLYRIQPVYSATPAVGFVPDAFAWPIIDLTPGTSYDVEVTVTSGAATNVKTLTHNTRALPGPAGLVTHSITAGSTTAQIQAVLNNLDPGSVLQFQDGTYDLTANLVLNRSGALNNPIYIRGASRGGVVLSNPGRIIQIQNASHVVIENMTLNGSGVEQGAPPRSIGIQFSVGGLNQTRITVRNITMNGVDIAIDSSSEISEFLAYDNTFIGNNTWIPSLLNANVTWNDAGIQVPGFGNSVFNNTLKGFGDSLSYAAHSGADTLTQSIGVHFYRNDVRNSGDDFAEVDHSHRNNTLYDNRVHNSMTFVSLDPLYGGPFVAARNISINTGRGPNKWNTSGSGQFFYNNTLVRTTSQAEVLFPGSPQEAGWYLSGDGGNNAQRSYGFRNNIWVYRGVGTRTIRLDNVGNDPIDWTHNSWYPNGIFHFNTSSHANLAAAYAAQGIRTPIFSGEPKVFEQDNITVSNPWTTTVTLGPDYLSEVLGTYTPVLSPGTTPKNLGVVIPNITDGFSGGAPDRGAIIDGRPIPQYGDRS